MKCEKFNEVAHLSNYPIEFNIQDGYDHSYYFISTFAEEHIQFHAKYLNWFKSKLIIFNYMYFL